jgi:hypothetical protein
MIKQMTVVSLFVLLPSACMSDDVPAADEAMANGTRMEISATLKCPIPRAQGVSPEVSTAATYLVAPGVESINDCDLSKLGPICTTLIMTRITCTWEDMKFGDQELTQSLWHGQGYREGDVAVAEQGYDSGQLASGDRYLSRWSEFQLPNKTIAIWSPVFGTGKLAGIAGQAVIECPPAEGVSIETCTVQGWYSLPEAD